MSDTKARSIRSDLSRKIQNVRNQLDDAQTRWNQAASILTTAYSRAFDNHHDGIKKASQTEGLKLAVVYGVATAAVAGAGLAYGSSFLQNRATSGSPSKFTGFNKIKDFFTDPKKGELRINATEDGVQMLMDKTIDQLRAKHVEIRQTSRIEMKPLVYKEALSRHIRNEFAPLKEACTALKWVLDEKLPLVFFTEGGDIQAFVNKVAADKRKLPIVTKVMKHPFFSQGEQNILIDTLYGQLSATIWWAWVLKNEAGNHFGLGMGASDPIIDAMNAPPDPNLFDFAKYTDAQIKELKGYIAKNPIAWIQFRNWAKGFKFHFDKASENSASGVFGKLWPNNPSMGTAIK